MSLRAVQFKLKLEKNFEKCCDLTQRFYVCYNYFRKMWCIKLVDIKVTNKTSVVKGLSVNVLEIYKCS